MLLPPGVRGVSAVEENRIALIISPRQLIRLFPKDKA